MTFLLLCHACLDVNYRMNEGLNFLNSPEVKAIEHLAKGQNLWGVVGKNEAKGSRTKLASLARTSNSKGRSYLQLGTQSGKDTLERRKKLTGSGPEVIHWPESMLKTKGTIYDFFKSMSAIVLRKIKGTNKTYWEDKKGNEVIDCWVYAYAALQLIKEKYPAIRTALAKPPETPPEPYQGIDMSHRSDANEANFMVVDDREKANAGARLIDVSYVSSTKSEAKASAPVETSPPPQKKGLAMRGGLQMRSNGKLRYSGSIGRRR